MTGDGSTKQPSDKAAYVPFLFSRVKRKTFSKIGPKDSKPGKASRKNSTSPSKPLRTKQELIAMHRLSPEAHKPVKCCCTRRAAHLAKLNAATLSDQSGPPSVMELLERSFTIWRHPPESQRKSNGHVPPLSVSPDIPCHHLQCAVDQGPLH
jgi:hypothetical protein